MHLLLRAQRLLSELDNPEAREVVKPIDDAEADESLVVAARQCVEDLGDDCEFDDWAIASRTDDGAWVNAWIWVPKEQHEEGDEQG